jgi:hypothetical protein
MLQNSRTPIFQELSSGIVQELLSNSRSHISKMMQYQTYLFGIKVFFGIAWGLRCHQRQHYRDNHRIIPTPRPDQAPQDSLNVKGPHHPSDASELFQEMSKVFKEMSKASTNAPIPKDTNEAPTETKSSRKVQETPTQA